DLFIEKLGALCTWYVNALTDWPCAKTYAKMVEEVEAMDRETFRRRRVARTGCWMQDAIQAALLGLAEPAREGVVSNFATSHGGSRFPAFWGPNHDWVPDQDHGGVAMLALQFMLLQPVGQKLHLLPAWPREWDVSFKLHAPGAVVEADYHDGAFRRLVVSPPERAADLVLPEG
ncbi:MAG: hypothetical protein HUU35_05965, partial [Armatimonadetes bacterium]|nr:hypothetical protein [Armatimonadota bacterium]